MRKFHTIYKEKQSRSNELFETKVLNDFKNVYSTLLDKYSIADFYNLNEEEQITFLAELNSYWSEEQGVLERGKKFLQIRSDVLSETSTTLQKKNFLKKKTSTVINESLRQSQIKWKLYDVIDEMYNEISASNVAEVLSPNNIIEIIKESFVGSLKEFFKEMRHELLTSATEVENEINEAKKKKTKDPKAKIRNRGEVVFSAGSSKVKDDVDHFPINSISQARNALARSGQYSSSPSWYKGSLSELKNKVKSAVKGKYPSIKQSK